MALLEFSTNGGAVELHAVKAFGRYYPPRGTKFLAMPANIVFQRNPHFRSKGRCRTGNPGVPLSIQKGLSPESVGASRFSSAGRKGRSAHSRRIDKEFSRADNWRAL